MSMPKKLNLYQFLRPTTFRQVVGHKSVTNELVSRSMNDNFSQVMLFSGDSGIGKTTLQRIIAKAITCENKSPEGEPCNECKFCLDVDKENFSLCVYEYDATEEGIAGIRRIEEDASTRPIIGKSKVFIIDEIQAFHTKKQAQERLLKLLEKKRKNVYFILGTMDASKVPGAIKDRSTLYKLRPIISDTLSEYLYKVVKDLGIEITGEEMLNTLFTIADHSQGSMRKAISYLERCVHGKLWDENKLIEELGLVSNETLINIAGGLVSGNVSVIEDTTINEEVLKSLKRILMLTYKNRCGLKQNAWEKKQIGGLHQLPANKIKKAIELLNDLNRYPYLTNDIITFTLLNIALENKAKERRPVHR